MFVPCRCVGHARLFFFCVSYMHSSCTCAPRHIFLPLSEQAAGIMMAHVRRSRMTFIVWRIVISVRSRKFMRGECVLMSARMVWTESQGLTTAMTRYKSQLGEALTFHGMHYVDVMRWQKQVQVPYCWRMHLHIAHASPTQKPVHVMQRHLMRLVSTRCQASACRCRQCH